MLVDCTSASIPVARGRHKGPLQWSGGRSDALMTIGDDDAAWKPLASRIPVLLAVEWWRCWTYHSVWSWVQFLRLTVPHSRWALFTHTHTHTHTCLCHQAVWYTRQWCSTPGKVNVLAIHTSQT